MAACVENNHAAGYAKFNIFFSFTTNNIHHDRNLSGFSSCLDELCNGKTRILVYVLIVVR